MATVDFRAPAPFQTPHRKPVPVPHISTRNEIRPLTKIRPEAEYSSAGPHHQQTTTITTTTSKPTHQAFPPRISSQSPRSLPSSQPYNNPMFTSRRTLSQSTTSSNPFTPSRTPSNVSSKVSRTSSTRSGASVGGSSYVSLMRKQKATVWCDRSQHEDPLSVEQQKAARKRLARELTENSRAAEGRTSTSGSMGSGSLGVGGKIRHRGIPKATGYNNANPAGGGVPMRLSANEVGDEGTYHGNPTGERPLHNRTSSGNSRDSRFLNVDAQQPRRYSQGSTSISGHGGSPNENIPELEETPVPGRSEGNDYFTAGPGHGGSGDSSDRENSFGNLGQMEAPKAKKEIKPEEDLDRRGSVHVRANPIKLFIVNPDPE